MVANRVFELSQPPFVEAEHLVYLDAEVEISKRQVSKSSALT